MQEPLDHWEFEEPEKKRLQFYKDFVSEEDLRAFTKLLYANDVPYAAEAPETIIDHTFVGTGMLPKAIVRIFPEDFPKVNALLAEQLAGMDFSQLQDHYLNQFEDAELIKIFDNPDKWSVEDGIVARIILRERGVSISDAEVQHSRDRRLAQIRKGRAGTKPWMAFYFLCIVLGVLIPIAGFIQLAFFIAGIGMGYYYAYGKSVDPDGNKHFEFNAETRAIGKVILYGGLATAFAVIAFLLMQ